MATSTKRDAVRVSFRCAATNCVCEVVVPGHVTVADTGGRLYEYETPRCPQCGHKIFRVHKFLGEITDSK